MNVDVVPFGDGSELDFVAGRAADLRPALLDVAEAVRGLYGDVFASRGVAAGVLWPGHTESYRRRKAKVRPGRPAGVFTGLLFGSLVRRGRYSVEHVYGDTVTVASRAPHAHLFESGRGGQRARRLTPSRSRIEGAAAEVLQAHLTGGRFTGLL